MISLRQVQEEPTAEVIVGAIRAIAEVDMQEEEVEDVVV